MDIVKLTFMIIGSLLIVLVAYIFSYRYYKKQLFYSQLYDYMNDIKNEINFFNTQKMVLVDSKKYDKYTELETLLCSVKNNTDYNNETIKTNEVDKVISFFYNLGSQDVESELNKIEVFLQYVETKKTYYYSEYVTKGMLSFKMGICIAIVFLIIFA